MKGEKLSHEAGKPSIALASFFLLANRGGISDIWVRELHTNQGDLLDQAETQALGHVRVWAQAPSLWATHESINGAAGFRLALSPNFRPLGAMSGTMARPQ